jgi:ligand-binding SRPBCC domain-containing protein
MARVKKRKPKSTVIERRERTGRPAPEVFRFFDSPANVKRATPESIAVTLERHPVDLRPGSIFAYRLQRWPLDLSWEVVVSEYRPPEGFTNVKSTGYFTKWTLAHEIIPAGGEPSEAELCLRLEYEVPSGIYANLSNNYVIRQAMEELVDAQLHGILRELHRKPEA